MESNATAIIIAADASSEWNNYQGLPRHLVPIEGERILDRAVRLIRPYGPEIWVVGQDDRYAIDGTKLYVPTIDPNNFNFDKFLNSRALWNEIGRTIVFYGDVYFTNRAVSKIMTFDRREWEAFGRFDGSLRTGSRAGEIFAHSFWPEHIDSHLAALQHLVELYRDHGSGRGSGWEHYRVLNGSTDDDMRVHRRYGHFVEINDWTDDFDFPRDYDEFVRRRRSRTYRIARQIVEAPRHWLMRLYFRIPGLQQRWRRIRRRTSKPERR